MVRQSTLTRSAGVRFPSSLFNMLFFIQLVQNGLLLGICLSILSLLYHYYLIEKLFNLIATFILVSFWLLLNGFEFVPLIMLIIYVGSIAVLFLFVVMIINPDYMDMRDDFFNVKYLWYRQDLQNWTSQHLKGSETEKKDKDISENNYKLVTPTVLNDMKNNLIWNDSNTRSNKLRYLFSYFFWSFLFFVVYFAGFMGSWFIVSRFYTTDKLVFVDSLNFQDNLFFGFVDVYYIANLLYGRFYFEFLLMGFLLFVAMVGVIMFGARKSLVIKRQNLSEQFFRYR